MYVSPKPKIVSPIDDTACKEEISWQLLNWTSNWIEILGKASKVRQGRSKFPDPAPTRSLRSYAGRKLDAKFLLLVSLIN